jgi:hypothetical protein
MHQQSIRSAEVLPEALRKYLVHERINDILRRIQRDPIPDVWQSPLKYTLDLMAMAWRVAIASTIPDPVQDLLQSDQPPTLANLLALAEAPTGNVGVYAQIVRLPTGSPSREVRPTVRLTSVLSNVELKSRGGQDKEAATHIALMTVPFSLRLLAISPHEIRQMIIITEAVLAVLLGAPDWASQEVRQASPWPDTLWSYTVALKKKNPLLPKVQSRYQALFCLKEQFCYNLESLRMRWDWYMSSVDEMNILEVLCVWVIVGIFCQVIPDVLSVAVSANRILHVAFRAQWNTRVAHDCFKFNNRVASWSSPQ